MSQYLSCRVIRMTPRGRGAVASLCVTGPDALAVLRPFLLFPHSEPCQSATECFDDGAPAFAYFQLAEAREEVVLHFRDHDTVELHCHGGDAVVRAIESELVERGAVVQTWRDWLSESRDTTASSTSFDMIRREALQLLPYAETELTARLLLAQYHGALSRRLHQVSDLLDAATNGTSSDEAVREATKIIDSLLQSYESGRHLTTPFRVSLIGAVNVGKSSLMNALLGFKRSIISPVAGTTRDTVSAKTVIGGWPVVLVDTAGMRETSNPIEREGISRMWATVSESDLLVQVLDPVAEEISPISTIDDIPNHVPVVSVINKIDLLDQHTVVEKRRQFPDFVPVSATKGDGIVYLYDVILCKLHKMSCDHANLLDCQENAIVFTDRQYAQLSVVGDQLSCGKIHCARAGLI